MLRNATNANKPMKISYRQIFLVAFMTMTACYPLVTRAEQRDISPALDDEYRSRAEVIAWVANQTAEIIHFDYDDFRGQLPKHANNFTYSGWNDFNAFLKQAGIINIILENMDGVRVHIDAAPQITSAGVTWGVYKWNINFPITISFNGKQPPPSLQKALALRLARVPKSQNPDGLAIDKWEIVDAKSN
jgi:hypothetical protein